MTYAPGERLAVGGAAVERTGQTYAAGSVARLETPPGERTTMTDTVRVALVGRLKHAKLYRFLRQRGWTQAALARHLGVWPSVVGKWMLLQDYPRTEALQTALMELTGESIFDWFPAIMRDEEFQDAIRHLPREFAVERELTVQAIREAAHARALPNPGDVVEGIAQEEAVRQLLATLSPREERILSLRFGLEDGRPKNIPQVSKIFGVSPERIRQIEAKAKRHLEQRLNDDTHARLVEAACGQEQAAVQARLARKRRRERTKEQTKSDAETQGVDPVEGRMRSTPYFYAPGTVKG